jgi:hypothetical protein
MKTLNRIAAAVSAATLATSAQAGIINTSISLNDLLNGSTSYSGSFAINPLLAANGLSGGTINSARISAYGYSDIQSSFQQTGYYENVYSSVGQNVAIGSYSYSCGWSTCYGTRYGYALYRSLDAVSQYQSRDDVIDTMRLSSGAGSANGSDSWSGSQYQNYNGSGSRSNGTYGYDMVYYSSQYTNSYYSGALEAGFSLSAQDVLALAQSGQFDYLVSAVSGNFRLNSVAITLDVSEAVAAAVPEPATAALGLAGLAALAAAARARRRQPK